MMSDSAIAEAVVTCKDKQYTYKAIKLELLNYSVNQDYEIRVYVGIKINEPQKLINKAIAIYIDNTIWHGHVIELINNIIIVRSPIFVSRTYYNDVAYTNMRAEAIISSLLSKLIDIQFYLQSESDPIPLLLKKDISDWNFFVNLCERLGWFFLFDFESNYVSLIIRDSLPNSNNSGKKLIWHNQSHPEYRPYLVKAHTSSKENGKKRLKLFVLDSKYKLLDCVSIFGLSTGFYVFKITYKYASNYKFIIEVCNGEYLCEKIQKKYIRSKYCFARLSEKNNLQSVGGYFCTINNVPMCPGREKIVAPLLTSYNSFYSGLHYPAGQAKGVLAMSCEPDSLILLGVLPDRVFPEEHGQYHLQASNKQIFKFYSNKLEFDAIGNGMGMVLCRAGGMKLKAEEGALNINVEGYQLTEAKKNYHCHVAGSYLLRSKNKVNYKASKNISISVDKQVQVYSKNSIGLYSDFKSYLMVNDSIHITLDKTLIFSENINTRFKSGNNIKLSAASLWSNAKSICLTNGVSSIYLKKNNIQINARVIYLRTTSANLGAGYTRRIPNHIFSKLDQTLGSLAKKRWPSFRLDLVNVPTQELFVQVSLTMLIKLTLQLKGSLDCTKKGEMGLIHFDKQKYIFAIKQNLGELFSQLTIVSFSQKQLSIGSSVVGEYWSDSVWLADGKLYFSAKPKSVGLEHRGWVIEGDMGFEIMVEDYDEPPLTSSTVAPSEIQPNLILEQQLPGMRLGDTLLMYSIMALAEELFIGAMVAI